MTPSIQLLTGDCRDLLRTLPAESVNTVCTSPPNWGLRDYGLPPRIWGGDPACEHEWNTERYYREGGGSAGTHQAFLPGGPENAARLKDTRWREDCRCALCGTWRGWLGMEPTPEEFVQHIVAVFREVHRVLRPDGTLWLSLGDSYAGSWGNYGVRTGKQRRRNEESWERKEYAEFRDPPATAGRTGLPEKNLVGISWRCALALQADGWILRSDVIWHKPNCTPESVKDPPTKAHEYIFLFSKSARYHYDQDAIREPLAADSLARARRGRSDSHKYSDGGPNGQSLVTDLPRACNPSGRNKQSVWSISSGGGFRGAHFAVMPPALVEPCIRAGTSEGGVCADCGAPRRRIVAKGAPLLEQQRACGGDRHGEYHGQPVKEYAGTGAQDPSATKARILAGMTERTTVGWEPTCACNAESVPATVLDPFAGAGTTLLVAQKLGRASIGLELNPQYAALAAARLHSG